MKTKTKHQPLLQLHKTPRKFIAAIEYTAGRTNFSAELIEKDYFCSVILNYLYSITDCPLVFKGGTLLTKVHTGFYRLSEDLDFSLPISSDATRKARSNKIKPIKHVINSIESQLSNFKVVAQLAGSNESRQYNATIAYNSILDNLPNKILIDIGLRENHLTPSIFGQAKTILLNPFTGDFSVPLVNCQCLSKNEAYAEKVRAALTRDRLAIRDYFDIYYAIKNNILYQQDPHFINLARRKMASSPMIEFNSDTISYLESKIITELIPNLRAGEANEFNLQETFSLLKAIADR